MYERPGDRMSLAHLSNTLELLVRDGVDQLYSGDLARAICAHVPLTLDDLSAYEVIERDPLAVPYRGHEFRTNPPPSSGGRLIAIGLDALENGEAVVDAVRAKEAARTPAVGGTTLIS